MGALPAPGKVGSCRHNWHVMAVSRTTVRRRRAVAAAVLAAVAAIAVVLVVRATTGEEPDRPVLLVPRSDVPTSDVLMYDGDDEALAGAAAFGLSHPLYAKSPGGVVAAARRTETFRELVDEAVDGSGFDADLIEAIVFLESSGRPEVIAGDDPARASGLTQILAETAQNFLGMEVDLPKSRELTRRIAAAKQRGDAAAVVRLRDERRVIDARFDPAQALAATVRYLTTAREHFGRDDLTVVSYHMGIGNLTNVLRAYAATGSGVPVRDLVADAELSWARVLFDNSPAHNLAVHQLLRRLGDDSPTYYWRVLAAREIMRLSRDDPDELPRLALLHRAKASAEEVLHPPSDTERFSGPDDVKRAWDARSLQRLPTDPGAFGIRVDPRMGELADGVGVPRALYQGLRPEALATLLYIGSEVRRLSGVEQPLTVTSTVRDEGYQRLLRQRNVEATAGYSLHTTGYSFDVLRRYQSGAQASAFQFVLDRLTARGLIAWVREPQAIHITVSSDAAALVPALLEAASE
jgi:soluble lytic murein transglycosylase-like protein